MEKKFLLIGLGAGLGSLFLILLIAVFSPGIFVKGRAIKWLEDSFAGRARAEKISFGWRQGLSLSNLFVQDSTGQRPILKAEEVRLRPAPLSLLGKRLVIYELEIKRPEMVIYRGGEGPRLDGAPELGPARLRRTVKRFKRKFSDIPEIAVARIKEGRFIFTDLRTGESARIENIDASLTGLRRPGGTTQLNGTFDIISSGVKDHAEISGKAEGLELGRLEAVRAGLVFKSEFANLTTDVDMTRLDEPGARLARLSLTADAHKTVTRLAPVWALPEGTVLRGGVDYAVDALAQSGKTVLLNGEANATDLYLKISPFSSSPFQSPRARLSHRLAIDTRDKTLRIDHIDLDSDILNLTSTGSVDKDKKVKLSLEMRTNVHEVQSKLACLSKSLKEITTSGDLNTKAELEGEPGRWFNLTGSSSISDLHLQSGSIRYSDSRVKLLHNLQYDPEEGIARAKELRVESNLLALTLREGAIKLKGSPHLQGNLSLLCHMNELSRVYRLPEVVILGDGRVNLEVKGPLLTPFYKGLTGRGSISIDQINHRNYSFTRVLTESLEIREGRLESLLGMKVNGAPARATIAIDLRAKEPELELELRASKVPVRQELALLEYLIPVLTQGRISGLVSLDAKARGQGLEWKKGLKKTLTAQGRIKVEEGSIYAGEVVTSILNTLGQPGREYAFSSITSDFAVKGERVHTENFQVQGSPFSLQVSGWTGLDRNVDYKATATIPRETLGKDLQKALGLLGKEKDLIIPVRITGNLSHPEVSLRVDAIFESFLKSLFDIK